MIVIGEPVVDVIEIKPKPVVGERMRLGAVSGHSWLVQGAIWKMHAQ